MVTRRNHTTGRLVYQSGRMLVPLVLVMIFLLAACGGDDPASETTVANEPRTDNSNESDGNESTDDTGEQQTDGICEILSGIDLEEAVDGVLTFGEMSSFLDGTSCQVRIEGNDGDGLIVRTHNADFYTVMTQQFEDDDAAHQIDLGREALLLTEQASLVVLVDDTTTLQVALGVGQDTWEAVQAGIIEITRQVLEEL